MAKNLMLYPMQKWDYAEPLLELLIHIKHILESDSCKFLIVVGYSFRDEHIRRMFWDVARINGKLRVVIIDPNAYNIYVSKLKYYDNLKEIPSSLSERVICLPYLFEKVLPILKNEYLKNLSEGLDGYNKIEGNFYRGIIVSTREMSDCSAKLANAEYCEILENFGIGDNDFINEDDVKIHFIMGINYLLNGQIKKSERSFKKYYLFLNKLITRQISLNIFGDKIILNHQDSSRNIQFLRDLMELSKRKLEMNGNDFNLENIYIVIYDLIAYLDNFKGKSIECELSKYFEIRLPTKEVRDLYEKYKLKPNAENVTKIRDELQQKVRGMEEAHLANILAKKIASIHT